MITKDSKLNSRLATDAEISVWDDLVQANPDGGNVLQSRAFIEFKARHGWVARYYIYELTVGQLAVAYLERKIPGLGMMWYAAKSPGVVTADQLAEWATASSKLSEPFMIKLEPEIERGLVLELDHHVANSKQWVLVKAPRDIQYNTNTVIVDLNPLEDEIIASLKQKTRYNVRLAEKKGVTVEAVGCTPDNLRTMYGLMQSTQARAGFFLRDYEYFRDFWTSHAEAGRGQLFFASYQGKVLAGDFVTYLGTKGLYKDGGSTREHNEVQAPYLLQWEVIRWLKAHGVTEYDLHGTPPAEDIENPKHPLAGLARFKTGFSPNVVEYIGTYDLVLSSARYRVWTGIGERIAASYSHRVKNELFY